MNCVKMKKKKDDDMQELSELMGKHSLGGNAVSDSTVKDTDESLSQVIDIASAKVEDIVESWKGLVADPLNCNTQSVQECLNHPELLKSAILSTFSYLKEIQEIFFEFAISDVEKDKNNERPAGKKEQTFINTQIFSSDSEPEREKEEAKDVVTAGAQVDLSEEEPEGATDGVGGCIYSTTVEYTTVQYSNATVKAASDCLNDGADESIYEDCEEEVQQDTIENSNEKEDDTYDGEVEDSSPESSDTESEDDPSWMVSDADSSGSDYEEDKRLTVKDMPKVNFAKTNVKSLGLWLSDNGPVHLNIMCHCKGMCVKNCACRTAGISCSVRCGCKTDKCKWRNKQEVKEEDVFDDEGFKNQPRFPRRVLGERDINKPDENVATPVKSKEETTFSTPALFQRPEKPKSEDTPGNDVFMTPACRPPLFSTDSSLLTSTAKKRNKKKLFTEAIGPQDFS